MSSPEQSTDAVGEEQSGEIENDSLALALLSEEPLSLVDDEWPTGTTLPLNSKCLNLSKWHSIAASFDLWTNAMLAETRLIVEGKLTEVGHDLFGAQVILSDSDESVLYLVNEGASLRE